MSLSRPQMTQAQSFLERMFPEIQATEARFMDLIRTPTRPNESQPGPFFQGCTLPPMQEFMLKALEDFVSTVIRLSGANSWSEWAHILWDLVRLRTGKSSISSIDSIFGSLIQEIGSIFAIQKQGLAEDTLRFFRSCLDSVEMFEKSAIAGKVYELFCYLLSHGMMGLSKAPFVAKEMVALFSGYKETRYESKFGFLKCILDFAVFMFERLSAYFVTGSFMNAFFAEADVSEWFIEAQDLIRLSQNYSNLSSLKLSGDWDQYSYIVRLDDAISKGQGYIAALKKTSRKDVPFIAKQVQALKLIRENNISRAEASKFRDPPCSFLLFGTSNIGKTLFMQNLISHICKTMGWPIDDRQMYAFVPGVKHHDGCFDGKRIIIMDELAPELPDKVTDVGQSSLGDVLKINNTAPFILPTAALELKGKVTFRPQLIVGSTNVMHLNAHAFYSCPLAVRRRFPYIAELKMKPEYASDGMLDPMKVPPSVGYADIWQITIWRIIATNPTGDPTKYKNGSYDVDEVKVLETNDSNEAYAFLSRVAVQHFENVAKAKKAYEEGKSVEICRKEVDGRILGCYMPRNKCKCVHMQAEEYTELTTTQPGFLGRPPQFSWREWMNLVSSLGTPLWLFTRYIPNFKFQFVWASYCSLLIGMGWPVMIYHLAFGSLWHVVLDVTDSPGQNWNWGISGLLILCQWFLMAPMWIIFVTVLAMCGKVYTDTLWRTTFLNFLTFIRMVRSEGWTKATRYMLFLSIRIVGKRVEESLAQAVPKDVISSLAFFASGFLLSKTISLGVSGVRRINAAFSQSPESDQGATPASNSVDEVIEKRYSIEPPPMASIVVDKEDRVSAEEMQEILSFADDHVFLQSGEEEIAVPERENIVVDDPEPVNVWYKEEFELTPLHLTPTSVSLKAMDRDMFLNKVRDNLYCLSVHRPDKGPTKWNRGKLFCVHENFFLAQKHFFDNRFPACVRVYKVSKPIVDDGIKDYQEFWIDKNQIVHEDRENIVLFLPELRMGKSMISVMSAQLLGGSHEGVLVRRQIEVDGTQVNCHRVTYGTYEVPELDLGVNEYARWEGDRHTVDGDCGSPLVVFTHYGPVIYGFHIAGSVFGPPIGFVLRLDLGKLLKSLLNRGINFKHSILDACLPLSADTAVRTLEPLHLKSPVRFIMNGCAHVYGSLSGPRAAPKSMVGKTPICHIMQRNGYKIEWGAPILSGWRPKHRVLQQAVTNTSRWNYSMLQTVMLDYKMYVLTSTIGVRYGPLSTDDAINGVPGVRFYEAMPRKTSAGYPWNRSKLKFLTRIDDKVYPNEELLNRMNMIERNALNGVVTYPVYTAALKDEPLKLSKISDYATRVFYGSPVDYSIVSRKYWLPMVRFIQNNAQIFGCYAGVNATSKQWDTLARNLVGKCGHARVEAFKLLEVKANVNDGDFKMFDMSWSASLLYATIDLLVQLLEHIGFEDRDIRAARVLAYASFNFFVNFFGDLLSPFGKVPSGWILTVIVNSLGNRLMVAYCYYLMRPRGCSLRFHEAVFFGAYGDDNLMGIAPNVPWFNHITLSKELAKLGFTFTTADKSGVPTPYRALCDVTFLKRSFRYDEDFGFIVAPLDEQSIIKSLMVCVRSKSVTPADQLMGQISSAARAYALYGRQVYESKCAFLRSCLAEVNLEHMIAPSTFPPFETIVRDITEARTFGHRVLT